MRKNVQEVLVFDLQTVFFMFSEQRMKICGIELLLCLFVAVVCYDANFKCVERVWLHFVIFWILSIYVKNVSKIHLCVSFQCLDLALFA